jgi:hypothetical protein
MGLLELLNGQLVELGQTQPSGLAIGSFSTHRKLIQWNIPNQGLVEMYVNPQSLSVVERKLVKETRTKGGYIIQYWGEALPEIDIQGTTGSGGIEGINVLRDIYRQEQVGFNTIIGQLNQGFLNNIFQTSLSAIQGLSNNPLSNPITSTINSLTNPTQFFNDVVTTVGNVANVFDTIATAITSDQQLLPTLAALATSVELWYDGVIYRGFFKEFRVDEKSDEVGLFRYSMKFTVTRRSGIRLNSYPWQRSVSYGPANSDIIPLSYGALQTPTTSTAQNAPAQTTIFPPSVSRRSLLTGR